MMHPSGGTSPHADTGAAARRLVLGVDLGKVTTCLAVGRLDDAGRLTVERTHAERHLGEPLRPFFDLYRSLDPAAIAGVVATGAFGDRLAAPARGGLPEEIALERAAELLEGAHGPLNVVRVGGSGYSVLTRAADGRVEYETNERCSAGTGETVEGLCSRLGRTLDEAIALAAAADDGIAVTSRCAVFAKSELTHFANQGEDHGRLFRGLFESVARNVHALYDRVKVDGPVVLVGHGALIGPLAEAFAALAGVPVHVSDQAGVFEALGALQAAAREDRDDADWPADPSTLIVARRGRIRSLSPAQSGPGAIVRLAAPAVAARPTGVVVLGLDIGSTGSKAVLYDARAAAAVADAYRRTDGNPVEAAKRLVEEFLGNGAREGRCGNGGLDVVAIGLTGSGRDAVATVMRAAYPELGEGLTVLNEIVAHAAAAVRHDADAGRSLSIVEIGGQDAKFINVRDGRVLESDMNRVCSAGTGSFLEEQAIAHGLDDIARFGELAARSGDPPDLGQTCTVFVADVAAEALADGFTRDDVFAGLQYSVIKNYMGRVMGDRRLLDRVFFQGKPATNPSLARTLAAVTGREVVVPPNPGAMGALGIAMLAAEAATAAGEAIDLTRFLSAEVVERRNGRCGDKDCRNLCRLETAIVEVAGERRRVVSGGNCPKYDTAASVGKKLPQDAPNPYRERDELLVTVVEEAGAAADAAAPAGPLAGTRVGLPYAHYLIDSLPFFAAWLATLAADVEVLRPTVETLAAGDRRCAAPGVCAPVKIAHGLTAAPLDLLFTPKFINLPSGGAAGTYTCPIAQGTPEMVAAALAAEGPAAGTSSKAEGHPAPRVVRPLLLRKGASGFDDEDFTAELEEAARGLGASGAAARAAHRAALAAQERYEAGLREIGERALAFAREEKWPVVLIVGETHVVHDAVINSGIHDLIAANGAVALPLDCFPVTGEAPALGCVHWAGAGQTLRASLAATRAGDVFPLLLCAYGCGPNSFVEHLFDDLLADYPHTVLESDGHGGAAGYATRVQAFLHAVQGFRESAAADAAAQTSDTTTTAAPSAALVPEYRLARCETPVLRSLRHHRDRTFLFGNIGGDLGRHVAAAMRGAGLDARSVGATSPAALERARQGCSGKECLPYQLIWGTLAEYLAAHGDELGPDGAVFVSIGQGFQACRANLFPLAEQIQLERFGFGGRIDVMDFTLLFEDWALTSVAWGGVVAVDLLNMMRFYHYATEPERGAADALFTTWADRLEALLEEPRGDGGKAERLVHLRRALDRVEELIGAAAREFAALESSGGRGGGAGSAAPPADLRTVFLCGDIYLRVDEWGNDDLQRKLADQGLRVVFEPFGGIFELLALRTVQDQGLTSRLGAKRAGTLKLMRSVVERLLGAAREHESWMFWNDVHDLDRESRALLDGYPFGESIPTIGGALLTWRQRSIDGVVVVSPRGCGPALVSEAQLRRGADFPLLFVYNDGDPIDAARLAGFAWRLRGRPARRVASLGRATL